MVEVIKCPHCGFDGEHKLLKVWKFRWWGSYLYECPQCKGRFTCYMDPSGRRKNFIIRVGKKRELVISA